MQTVDIPVPRGDPQDFHQVPGAVSLSSESAEDGFQGVFRTFPRGKKSAEVARQVGANMPRDVSSWTPAAYEVPSGSDEWVELYDAVKSKTYYWNRRTHATSWNPHENTKVVWVGEKGAGGEAWYWHRVTRVSTYVLPPLPPRVRRFGVRGFASPHPILGAITGIAGHAASPAAFSSLPAGRWRLPRLSYVLCLFCWCGLCWFVVTRAVSPWVVDWRIMVGLDQMDSHAAIVATLVVVNGGIYRAGFAGYVACTSRCVPFVSFLAMSVEESVAALVVDNSGM